MPILNSLLGPAGLVTTIAPAMYSAAVDGLNRGSRAKAGVSGWGQQLVREARSAAPAAGRVPAGNYQSPFSGMRDQAVRNARNGIQWGEPPSARIQPPVGPAAGDTKPPGGGDPNGAPVPRVTPRAEVQSQALGTAIQQAQGPSFWESNTALKQAAESGVGYKDDGYLQRADIQAWMKANPKLAEQMLARRRAQGLSDGTAAAGPTTSDDAILRAQGAGALDDFKGGSTDDAILWAQGKGALGETQIQQPLSSDEAILRAQAAGSLDGFKGGSTDDAILWAQGNGGLEVGRPYVTPESTRYQGQQPAIAAQQQATEPINFADALAVKSPLLERHLRLAGWGG